MTLHFEQGGLGMPTGSDRTLERLRHLMRLQLAAVRADRPHEFIALCDAVDSELRSDIAQVPGTFPAAHLAEAAHLQLQIQQLLTAKTATCQQRLGNLRQAKAYRPAPTRLRRINWRV